MNCILYTFSILSSGMVSKNAQSGLHTCCALEKNPYFRLYTPVIRKRDQLPPFLLRFSQNIKFFSQNFTNKNHIWFSTAFIFIAFFFNDMFTYSVVTVYQDFKTPRLNERVKVVHKTKFYSYESLYEPILTKQKLNWS